MDGSIHPFDLTIEHPASDFATCLPKWIWFPNPDEYVWSSNLEEVLKPQNSIFTQEDWETCLSFFKGLKWKQCDSLKTAFIELAYAFWHAGYKLNAISQTIAAYTKRLQKFISQALKAYPATPIVPGSICASCKSEGKTLPSGYIKSAYPLLPDKPPKALALPLFRGRAHSLKLWEEAFYFP